MYLFKLEIEMADQTATLIVVGETNEKVFDYVEEHLVKHYMVKPEVKSITLVEKKRLDKGAGYVIET